MQEECSSEWYIDVERIGMRPEISNSPLQNQFHVYKVKPYSTTNLFPEFILHIYDQPYDVLFWSNSPNLQPNWDVQLWFQIKSLMHARKH